MTDLEMTRLCAQALFGKVVQRHKDGPVFGYTERSEGDTLYCSEVKVDPLRDDAQAMALLILLLKSGERVVIENNERGTQPILVFRNSVYPVWDEGQLRRAVVECVAKIQAGKNG